MEERVEEPVQSALGEASMFEEVFEEDLSAVPPLQAATPLAAAPAVAEPRSRSPPSRCRNRSRPARPPCRKKLRRRCSDALAAEAAPPASEAAEVAVPVDRWRRSPSASWAQISEKVIREIAWEVIPDLAEALIRKEIERLKAELQQS